MADAKITALTALTTVADEDLLAVVDDPSGTPTTKKITRSDLLGPRGTFTPSVEGTTSGTATHVTQVGKYSRIGDIVFFWITVIFTKGTVLGSVRIRGLPVTSGGTHRTSCPIGKFDTITFNTVPMADILPATTEVRLLEASSAVAIGNITDSDLHATNQMVIEVSGAYPV